MRAGSYESQQPEDAWLVLFWAIQRGDVLLDQREADGMGDPCDRSA